MVFELFCPVYNEATLLPYTVKFYRDILQGHDVVFNFYDNGSTDDTVFLASNLGCNVGIYETKGQVRDDLLRDFKNNIWKTSKADWVIIIDCDEWVHINPDHMVVDQYTILGCKGYNMVGDGIQTPDTITDGLRFEPQDKTCVFSPKYIKHINYNHGAHNCSPVGEIRWVNEMAPLYHMKFISEDHVAERFRLSKERLSDINKKFGWGTHYNMEDSAVREMYRNAFNAKTKVR